MDITALSGSQTIRTAPTVGAVTVRLVFAVALSALSMGAVSSAWGQAPPPPPNQAELFTIVSIADGHLLATVLDGVAMLTNRANFFDSLVAFGLLCGVLVAAARALVTQRLELQYLLVGWMMYAAMYGPKVDTVVWDLETQEAVPVDNVPIGVAAVGGVTSLVGLNMARAFTTVFNLPGAAGSTTPLGLGFADPLSMLVELRDLEYGGVNDANAGGTDPNTDVQRTISRYIRDCVMYAVGMEGSPLSKSWESLRTAPDLLAAMEVPAVSWHTVSYLPVPDGMGGTVARPNGAAQTCLDAHAAISGTLTGGFNTARMAYLGAKLNMSNPQAEVEAAMDYFFGAGRDAQDLMLNALLANELELASIDYQATAGNSARVTMLTQAMEQRRTQWTAEKTLFEEVAQPLMAYIEAFFYAVSPVMAFLFVLGPFGMKLFGRYLMLAAWIQLWIPIMALNNLYIHHSARRNIESLIDGGGADILSMVGLNSVWTETASWLAVGGMMAAATPLLALMLLSGSYFAMTQLTNRMSGRDFTQERIVSPDLVQPAPVASAGTMFQHEGWFVRGPGGGSRMVGADQFAPAIEMENVHRQQVQHAESVRSSAVDGWVENTGVTARGNVSRNEAYVQGAGIGESVSGSSTHVDEFYDSGGQQIVKNAELGRSLSEKDGEMLQRALQIGMTGSLGAQGGVGPFKGNAGVAIEGSMRKMLTSETSLTDTDIDKINASFDRHMQDKESHRAAFADALMADATQQKTSRFTQELGVTDTKAWEESRKGLREAAAQFSVADSMVDGIGSDMEMSATFFGEQFRPWQQELQRVANDNHLDDEATRSAYRLWESGTITNWDQAKVAGLGLVLSTSGDPEAATGLARVIADRFGLAGERSFGAIDAEGAHVLPERSTDHRYASGPAINMDHDTFRQDVTERAQIPYEGLFAEGRAAAMSLFAAGVEGNAQRAEEAGEALERWHAAVVADHAEEHYEASNLEDRLNDWDPIAGSMERLGIVATGTRETYEHAYATARDAGDGPWAASAKALAHTMTGADGGVVAQQRERIGDAYQMAADNDVPHNVAWLFAQDVVPQTAMTNLARETGLDEEYAQVKGTVKEGFGGNETAQALYHDAARLYRNHKYDQAANRLDQLGSMYEAGRVSGGERVAPINVGEVPERTGGANGSGTGGMAPPSGGSGYEAVAASFQGAQDGGLPAPLALVAAHASSDGAEQASPAQQWAQEHGYESSAEDARAAAERLYGDAAVADVEAASVMEPAAQQAAYQRIVEEIGAEEIKAVQPSGGGQVADDLNPDAAHGVSGNGGGGQDQYAVGLDAPQEEVSATDRVPDSPAAAELPSTGQQTAHQMGAPRAAEAAQETVDAGIEGGEHLP